MGRQTLPRDVEGTIEVIYDGRTGQSNFSTSKEGATCLTTPPARSVREGTI